MEIAMFGIDKQRVFNDIAFAMASLFPVFERQSIERHGIRRVPVHIMMDFHMLVRRFAAEQRTLVVPIDDVVRERETAVVFDARPLYLPVHAERQDVVADDVVASVMLMETTAAHMVDKIVLHDDFRRAFIRVEALPARTVVVV